MPYASGIHEWNGKSPDLIASPTDISAIITVSVVLYDSCEAISATDSCIFDISRCPVIV